MILGAKTGGFTTAFLKKTLLLWCFFCGKGVNSRKPGRGRGKGRGGGGRGRVVLVLSLNPPPTWFWVHFCQILTTRSNPNLFSGHFLNKITKISHSILQPIFLQTHSVRAIYTIHLTGHFFTKSQCSSNPLFVGPFFNNIKKIIHHCFLAIFFRNSHCP